jgi:hypothetical protein
MLDEYKGYIKKSLRPKRAPISPGVNLRPDDSPTLLDPAKQKFYRSFVAKLQFAVSWIRFDISFAVSGTMLHFGRHTLFNRTSSPDEVC